MKTQEEIIQGIRENILDEQLLDWPPIDYEDYAKYLGITLEDFYFYKKLTEHKMRSLKLEFTEADEVKLMCMKLGV